MTSQFLIPTGNNVEPKICDELMKYMVMFMMSNKKRSRINALDPVLRYNPVKNEE